METGPEKPIKTVPVRETGLHERPESPDIKDVILRSPVFILSFRTFYSTKAGKEAAKGTAPSRSNGPHSHQSSQHQAVRFADKRKNLVTNWTHTNTYKESQGRFGNKIMLQSAFPNHAARCVTEGTFSEAEARRGAARFHPPRPVRRNVSRAKPPRRKEK